MDYKPQYKHNLINKSIKKLGLSLFAGVSLLLNPLYLNAEQSKAENNQEQNTTTESVTENAVSEDFQVARRRQETNRTRVFGLEIPENLEKIIFQGYVDFRHKPIQVTKNSNLSFDSRHSPFEHSFNTIFRINTPVRFYSRANITTKFNEFNPDFRYTLGASTKIESVSLTAAYQENHLADREPQRRLRLEARLRY